MAGWNSTHGDIKKYIASEDELWALANYVFSESCKKTSTYKFGFLKSILDSLFSGELTNRGYELTFQTLFSRFAENYWNLVTKYHLKQMRYNGSGELSGLEIVFNNAIAKTNAIEGLEFSSISDNDRNAIIAETINSCKRNVVGALYGDFDGLFYGFDLKEKVIWINPVSYEFLLKYKFELDKLNYYAWAKYLEKINSDGVLVKVLDKLDDATPKRNNLYVYREILRKEFEQDKCFYCGKSLSEKADVDHILPWKLVREDRIWNFVLSCKSCNSKKSDKIPSRGLMIGVLDRNERIATKTNEFVIDQMKGYSAEKMMRLWSYAKIGGYKEYSVTNSLLHNNRN